MGQVKKHKHKDTYFNDIALRLGQKLLGLEHLHYGYFKSKSSATLHALPAAQKEYVKNVVSFIPRNIKDIFDVGCGTGGVAKELVKKKYAVTCLAPDPYLVEKTLENTGHAVKGIIDLYENITDIPAESFDLILMSESCQYIKIREGWEQNRRFLRKGGYVLVSDFFRTQKIDKPYLSKSGHPVEEYLKAAEEHGFRLLKKKDITKFVSPTMDIYQEILLEKVFPVAEALFEIINRKIPLIYKLFKLLIGKKVLFLREKYSHQGSTTFEKYKSYYIFLFQKI